jgi:lysophospholipase L1-like esterase
MPWSTYVSLGDSLTAGRGDAGPDGRRIGWAQRLADILGARTSVPCALTNLAVDGATVTHVLRGQLPKLAALSPDLISVTVGMNDIRGPAFDDQTFTARAQDLLDGLTATGATVLTCTLPDIAGIVPLPPELVGLARERLRQVGDIIREQAVLRGVVCLDAWLHPGVADPDLFSADRLHPNASGHRLIAKAFADLLAPVAGVVG